MEFTDLYIDGAWHQGAEGKRFDVVNPADEKIIASVASAEIADVEAALDAAERAQVQWAGTQPRQRAEILRAVYESIIAQRDALAHLVTLENGKAAADAQGEITYAAEFFRWFSEEAVRAEGQISQAPSSGAKIIVQYKPAGIAAMVTPWNYPAAMATRKIAPALAAGCATVIKPAAETPLTMLALMPLLEQAGVPKGLVNVLPAARAQDVVAHMMNDARVRVFSFTGSTNVGKHLIRQSADQVLKPAMELGGNAPVIVFDDADLDVAVEGAMLAKMRNLGEACTAANRIYVQDGIHDAFVQKFTAAMGALKMGDGRDGNVDVGPLITEKARADVAALVEDAVAKGATVHLGGQVPDGPGFFYPPTVMSNVADGSECLATEIFGPVAAIQSFSDTEDVIARANGTEYGLVGYVFTRDLKKGLQVSERLEFGMIGLNRGLVSDPAAPFGGVKQSGLGREGGHEGMLEFMEAQYISTDW